MTCKRTDLAPDVTVWSCGRGRRKPEDDPVCEICRVHPAVKACAFELRGAKAGQLCGRKLCRKCAADSALCPPHRRMVVAEIRATEQRSGSTG